MSRSTTADVTRLLSELLEAQKINMFQDLKVNDRLLKFYDKIINELKHIARKVQQKKNYLKKLEEHLVKGTFPTDISFKFSGYSQYPSSIPLEEIKRLREEETTIVHEASLRLLTIRRNAILADLEKTESLARDMSKTSFFTNSVNEEFGPSFFPKTLIIYYTNEFELMVKKLKGLPPPTPAIDPTDALADDNDDVIDIPNDDELNSSSSTRLVTFRTIDRQFSSRTTDSTPRQQIPNNRAPEKNSRSTTPQHDKNLAQQLFNLLPELESILKKKKDNEKDNSRRQKNESRRGRSTTRSRDASHEPRSKSRSSQRSLSSNSTKNNQSKKSSQDNNKKKKNNSNSNNRPRSRSNNRGRGQGKGSGNRKKY